MHQVLNNAHSLHLLCALPPGRREEDAPADGKFQRGSVDEPPIAGSGGENARSPAAKNGVNPDISQQSFHNSSIFARRSLTKLVSFRETFQDEIAK